MNANALAPRRTFKRKLLKALPVVALVASAPLASAADLDGADVVTAIGTAKTVMLSILGAATTILVVSIGYKVLRRASNKV